MNIADLNALVVEDDDFQREMLANMLSSLGVASVSKAENGIQALEVINGEDSKPVNVALCDLSMPEMDGMEFLRHLGKENRNIAVILTSALDGKLLASVARMTKLYGIKLLGTIEKPVLLVRLKELLLKYDGSVMVALNSAETSFSLDEILRGIQANQFEPFFQPKVDLKTCRIVGAEALARWKHPEHGVVGPEAFIPQLEQAGNIDGLTFHILKKSAAACRFFHHKGHLLTVAVNLSLVSLDDVALADKITQMVRESGVDPQYITLEVTESAAMTNVASALENLARLCMNGFSLSIDDYGTGSSNLQQLTRIAFSELKIDQSFVKDFSDNKALRIVVESSIDMAHKLMVKSVAEGVETEQDWNALATVRCDTAQGYFIAKPMDVKAFGAFVENYKSKPAPLPVPQPVRQQNNIKILVVEDDKFTRKIILHVLRDLGFLTVTDVDSAESAIDLFESHAFDLIITDINMPGMNGLKFIQKVRTGATYAKPDTRIVVLTSFSQTDILAAALALDINGFLVKPIVPAVAEEKLAQAMSERLHIHSPVAYGAVKTDTNSLSDQEEKFVKTRGGAAITLGENAVKAAKRSRGYAVPLSKLQPGMILKEDVYLKDGTLILSSGHSLSEPSINRLIDLKVLLPVNGIMVQ